MKALIRCIANRVRIAMSEMPSVARVNFMSGREVSGSESVRENLERGRLQSGFAIHDLWLQCFGMGFDGSVESLEAIFEGTEPLSRGDYDLIAHCLNERLKELGMEVLVPYGEEIDI